MAERSLRQPAAAVRLLPIARTVAAVPAVRIWLRHVRAAGLHGVLWAGLDRHCSPYCRPGSQGVRAAQRASDLRLDRGRPHDRLGLRRVWGWRLADLVGRLPGGVYELRLAMPTGRR